MDQQQPPRSSSSAPLFLLALLPLLALGGFIFFFVMGPKSPPPAANKPLDSGFNVEKIPETPDEPNFSARLPAGTGGPAIPKPTGPGLSGFIVEKDKMFQKDPEARKEAERSKELAFIKKNDHLIVAEQKRLKKITDKYYKEHKIVREVDEAFTKNAKFNALVQQYRQDRDAYALVRGAIADKGTRSLIRKYAVNADVWKAGMGMAGEALKKPPPKNVYDEMSRFMNEDKQVKSFMGSFMDWIKPKAPGLVLQSAMDGQDLGPLKKVINDVSPGAVPGGASSRRKRR